MRMSVQVNGQCRAVRFEGGTLRMFCETACGYAVQTSMFAWEIVDTPLENEGVYITL
jgi:hypothetical protein